MSDDFSARHADLLTGSYDCVDRIVLNGYFTLGHNPGGFRTWWRWLHDGSDEQLDNAHLQRMAGRFARRVKAFGAANDVPVVFVDGNVRKHELAEEYLATHSVGTGVFMVLASRAPATVWDVQRSAAGTLVNLRKKSSFVNHYSFHIMDPVWGHMTIKMSGHPPFGTQIILNGHEYVAIAAQAAGIGFHKEGNCFTQVSDPVRLAQIAETVLCPPDAAVGRLRQACDRWIYSACLCFGLDLDQQQASKFTYSYSVYQAEYSRNLLFSSPKRMQQLFDRVVDRTRTRLDMPAVRTIFGTSTRPKRAGHTDDTGIVIERPRFDLTYFKLAFDRLQAKAYTKGEHVLRFEATVHNTAVFRKLKNPIGRSLENFPAIIDRLRQVAEHFTTAVDCIDTGFLPDGILDELPQPGRIGTSRIGGIDVNKPRIRTVLAAVTALAPAPNGFTVTELADKVHRLTADDSYTVRQAAYDLRKLRAKQLIDKPGRSRRYHVPPSAARTITALTALRDQVIAPIIAGVRSPHLGRKPKHWTNADRDYEKLRIGMEALFEHVGIEHQRPAA